MPRIIDMTDQEFAAYKAAGKIAVAAREAIRAELGHDPQTQGECDIATVCERLAHAGMEPVRAAQIGRTAWYETVYADLPRAAHIERAVESGTHRVSR